MGEINLPSMPTPSQYGYDPKDTSAVMGRAKRAYEDALKIWQQTSLEIAKTLAGKG